MKLGAGFFIVCPNTGHILTVLRNDTTPVWSILGGTLEKYERSIQCAKREILEEAGFIEGRDYSILSIRPSNIGRYPNFVYRTFIAVMKEELIPTLNYENITYKWTSLNEIPNPKHFGLIQLLSDIKFVKKIQQCMNKYE